MPKTFIDGLSAKEPHPKSPDFVKAKLSIKREALLAWLSARTEEWINADVLQSPKGSWYVALDEYKRDPSKAKPEAPVAQEEIPF